jgi:hypothetical protein
MVEQESLAEELPEPADQEQQIRRVAGVDDIVSMPSIDSNFFS